MAFGDIHIGSYRFLRLFAAVARKTAKQRIACAGRFRTVQVFTG